MKLGVIFKKHVRPYFTGEKAGFEAAEAEDLVKRGLAGWDERLNPAGKPLAHEQLDEAIQRHREAIEEADKAAGLPLKPRQAGEKVAAVKAEAVPEPEAVVEKGSKGFGRR